LCALRHFGSGIELEKTADAAASARGAAYPGFRAGTGEGVREDGGVKTRTLLVLAAITGVAILAAGAVQILLAR
jgi:hypothetical protein